MRTCIICNVRPVYGKKYSYCSECQSAVAKKWRSENIEHIKARAKEAFATLPPRVKWLKKLLSRYGLTVEQYEVMYEAQARGCAICGEPPQRQRLSIDHDHSTGEVRGLLCERCNSVLGRVKDDPMVLVSAASYLMEHGSGERKELVA